MKKLSGICYRPRCTKHQAGFTLTEVMVACGVLAVILPTMTSLFVRSRRVMQQTRHERVMLDELSNQLDVLMIDPEQFNMDQSVSLPLSAAASSALPTASVMAKVIKNKSGRWMTVTAKWKHGEISRTRSLVSWIDDTAGSDAEDEETKP